MDFLVMHMFLLFVSVPALFPPALPRCIVSSLSPTPNLRTHTYTRPHSVLYFVPFALHNDLAGKGAIPAYYVWYIVQQRHQPLPQPKQSLKDQHGG